MHGFRWNDPRFVLSLVLGVMARDARAENLRDAWTIALGTNAQLQASRQTSAAASQELASSRSARLPQIQTLNAQAFLSNPVSVPSSSGQPKAASGGQDLFTISAVAAIVPIYTGGRIRNTVASNRAQLNASRADEATTALDLKLEVARAYVDVLRANRGVAVAESNVVSLTAQARDVANLVTQGRGIRNDLLAAQVARANAQQRNIQARNRLSVAWATYNRYLCRSMDTVVPLEELAQEAPPQEAPPQEALPPRSGDAADTAMLMQDAEPIVVDEAQIQTMVLYAMKNRPELASLAEQARSIRAQAAAERANTRPQVSFLAANLYQNARFLPTEADSGAAAFVLNWTLFDGGKSRHHAMALEERAASSISRQYDLAAGIKLQVRSAWLTCQENQRRIPLTRAAIVQAEENLRVARSRYLQQRGTNTEVLDAETARIQSYDNYYSALYDAIQADFELRRAVGDI
ncbi:MAG: TolC family protein [Planctomycetaceae bacterium]|nr:TolC family protein [Planctomycetaceae bacterium]